MMRSTLGRGDLRVGEAHDRPAAEERFEILFSVGDETRAAIVATAAFDVDATLDLDECAALDVREVRAPFALRVKDKLALQLRPAKAAPVEGELRFEPRAVCL